jgi:hypothetical protein
VKLLVDSTDDLIAEAEAGMTWVSGAIHWKRLVVPAVVAVLGIACVGFADAAALNGASGMVALWWVGVLAIFVPAAATLFFVRVSRTEAVSLLLLVGISLYAVKLLYAPGMTWGYDELLHYRTIDNLLTTGHLFTRNSLLPVSPFYPGMESATAVIVDLTGLSITQSGLVLIGIARLLTVLGVFLLLERIAMPSRFAATATLLYMACPAFLYFDSMFSYESLALALSLVVLFVLRAAQLEEGARRRRLNVIAAILVLGVVVTHHVTSFILAIVLVAWTLVELYHALRIRKKSLQPGRSDSRTLKRRVYLSNLPGSLWVPILTVTAVTVWLLNVAEITISYLWPQLMSGLAEAVRMIRFQGAGRKLFESSAGHSAPFLERAVGIGSVLIILILIPIGMKYLWERRHSNVLSHFLAVGSLAYPAILALRFTRSGWDVGSRATAFVYLPLAFTIAAGMELLIAQRFGKNRLRQSAIVVLASIIFAGGIIAGTSPVTRMPAPYDPGIAEVPYDIESLAAANWAASTLGPGNRFVADSAGGALIGSIGRQQLLTTEDGVAISALFLSPGFDTSERRIVKDGQIDYVLVDRRIVGTEPLKGFIYEKWEREVRNYGSSIDSATVNKFDVLRDASKVFDSGNVQLFELHRLAQ